MRSPALTDLLARHGIVPCGDNSCIFGSPGGMGTNGGCRCGSRDPRAPDRPTALSRRLAHAVIEQTASIARLTAELPRLTAELAAARAVPADVEHWAIVTVATWLRQTYAPFVGDTQESLVPEPHNLPWAVKAGLRHYRRIQAS